MVQRNAETETEEQSETLGTRPRSPRVLQQASRSWVHRRDCFFSRDAGAKRNGIPFSRRRAPVSRVRPSVIVYALSGVLVYIHFTDRDPHHDLDVLGWQALSERGTGGRLDSIVRGRETSFKRCVACNVLYSSL